MKDTQRLKVKGWKNIFHASGKGKKTEVAMLISDKISFTTKAIVRDYIMIQGTLQQEDITLVNSYAPNTGEHKHVKQILMDIKGEINRNTLIVGDFNTLLISMVDLLDRKSKKKQWHIRSDQLNLYFQSISPPNSRIYILFKCS